MTTSHSANDGTGNVSPVAVASSGKHSLAVSSVNNARAPVLLADARKRQGERLRDAATRGDVRGVNDMLAQGARPNEADSYGDTALHKAAQYGHTLVIEALLNEMAEVDAIGWDGRTPLHECAIHGHARCAEKLLAAGANFLVVDNQGVNVRERALRNRKMDIVRLFDAYAVEAKPTPRHVDASTGALATSVAVPSPAASLTAPTPEASTPVSPEAPAPAAARRSYPPREWAAPKPTTPAATTASLEENSEDLEETQERHSRLQRQREDIMRNGHLSPTLERTETVATAAAAAADPPVSEEVSTVLVPVETSEVEPDARPAGQTSSSLGTQSTPPVKETAEPGPETTRPSAALQDRPGQSSERPLNKSAALYQSANNSELIGLRSALEQERREHQATKAAAERTERALQIRIAALEKKLCLEEQNTVSAGTTAAPSAAAKDKATAEGIIPSLSQTGQKLTDDQKVVAVSFLSAVPLLKAFSPEEQMQLASVVRLTEYEEGSLIIEQGARGSSCHFLYSGDARAEKDGSIVWSEYCIGDFFGELALLEDRPRAASIRAVGPGGTKCFTLGREEFQRIVGRSGDVLKDRQKAYDLTTDAAALHVVSAVEDPPRTTSTMLSAHRTPIARKPKALTSSARVAPVVAAAGVQSAADDLPSSSEAEGTSSQSQETLELLAKQLVSEEQPQLESKKQKPRSSRKGKNKGSGKAPPPLPAHTAAEAVDRDEEAGAADRRATRNAWGLQLQLDAAEVSDLAEKVERNAADLDRQNKYEVAPELARYQELLELIVAGKGTDADNIEMERLGALLDLESAD